MLDHISIRTADIFRSIQFYELLGFTVIERFTTGYTLACWLEGLGGKIELILIPEPHPTPDTFHNEHYTGYYHASFNLTLITPSLSSWLEEIKLRFLEANFPLTLLLPPTQQMIGEKVYEVLFIADSEGLPLEFIRFLTHP